MVEYSEHSILSGGSDITLSIWEHPSPDAAVIFIPATMMHPLCYEDFLKRLSGNGYTVVGLHTVGHGKSARYSRKYTLRDLVQNARDAVTYAIEKFKIPVVVMGTSQGGIVAAGVAAEDERIAAVFSHNMILSELPETVVVTRYPQWLKYIYRPWINLIKLSAGIFPDMEKPADFYLDLSRVNLNERFSEILKNDPLCVKRYSLRFIASLITTHFPGLTDGSVRCPMYIVADSGDRLFPLSYMQKVFDSLCAPHKEIVLFNTGGHMLMLTHPKEACDTLSVKIHSSLKWKETAQRNYNSGQYAMINAASVQYPQVYRILSGLYQNPVSRQSVAAH